MALAYHMGVPWDAAVLFEEALRRNGTDVRRLDVAGTPGWIPGPRFLVPKRRPVGVRAFRDALDGVDAFIQVDAGDNKYLRGIEHLPQPTAFWAREYWPVRVRFYRELQRRFDLVFSSHWGVVEDLRRTGRCEFLPSACDPGLHRPLDVPKVHNVTFVGTARPRQHGDRRRILDEIRTRFGLNWPKNVWGEATAREYSQSRIVFAHSPLRQHGLNQRIFEALACGTLCIARATTDRLGGLFQDRKHLVLYRDRAELMDLIAYYLDNDEEREAIAAAGHELVHAEHTYDRRARQVLKALVGVRGHST